MSSTTLYMISYHAEETPSGIVQEWFTTFSKAMKRLRQLNLSDTEKVNAMEVPRTKVALAEWLNSHAKVG